MGDLFDLSGKTAIVTGGAGLIGTSLSEGLYEHGATVVVAESDVEAGAALSAELGERAWFAETDVTDEESVSTMVEATCERFGGIDVLVNAAYPKSAAYGAPFESVDVDQWRESIDLQLNSCYLTTYEVVNAMLERGTEGTVINIGSTYGIRAPDFSVYEGTEVTCPVEYAAIKGGLLNLTRYLASYLGPRNIRVNAISPGGVANDQDSTFVARYERRTPLGRMADPADLKGAVVFLASDAAEYVTGHNLVVDGGWTVC